MIGSVYHVINVITLLLIGLSFFACENRSKQDRESAHHADSMEVVNKELARQEAWKQTLARNRKRVDDEYELDSLQLAGALTDVLAVAAEHVDTDNFKREYEIHPDDTTSVDIEITIGNLFANNTRYLLVRRRGRIMMHVNVYRIADRQFKNMIDIAEGRLMYVRDTIFDANGDGTKDFLLHLYPVSGCCLRNNYEVYLNLQKKDQFSEPYNFINPTFSPKEHIIRGVEYGHPGEVGLYKYKWSGLDVDTIEFIHPDVTDNQQFVKTKKNVYQPSGKDGVVLKAVPKEYRSIDGYDWFTMY